MVTAEERALRQVTLPERGSLLAQLMGWYDDGPLERPEDNGLVAALMAAPNTWEAVERLKAAGPQMAYRYIRNEGGSVALAKGCAQRLADVMLGWYDSAWPDVGVWDQAALVMAALDGMRVALRATGALKE